MRKNVFIISILLLLYSSYVATEEVDHEKRATEEEEHGGYRYSSYCYWGSSYGSWGNCSAKCGGGQKTRYQSCYCTTNGGRTSTLSSYTKCMSGYRSRPSQKTTCNTQSCCHVSWTDWSECSAPCGGGTQTRSQQCVCEDAKRAIVEEERNENDNDHNYPPPPPSYKPNPPPSGPCDHLAPDESRSCNTEECCFWENWSDWSSCDNMPVCNVYGYKKTRYRDCACYSNPQQPQAPPQAIPQAPSQAPNPPYGNDNDHNPPPPNYYDDDHNYNGRYKRAVLGELQVAPQMAPQPVDGQEVCASGASRQWEEDLCSTENCCNWGDFAEWTACSKTCSVNGQAPVRTRRRACQCPSSVPQPANPSPEAANPAPQSANPAPQSAFWEAPAALCALISAQPYEAENCNDRPCCTWALSGDTCSAACPDDNSNSTTYKVCVCDGQPTDDVSQCEGLVPPDCPECYESDCCTFEDIWSEWSECSASCQGTQWRQSFCNCTAGITTTITGSGTSNFTSNTTHTDNSTIITNTTIIVNITIITNVTCNCPEGRIDIQSCTPQCCRWSNRYTDLTACNKPCNRGKQFSVQICECPRGEAAWDDAPPEFCDNVGPPDVIVQDCNTEPCCSWSEWSEWGNCSTTCGGGAQTRTRDCTCPTWDAEAIYPDYLCTSDTSDTVDNSNDNDTTSNEEQECGTESCCDWGEWGPWSTCSKKCDTGYHYRYKQCHCQKRYLEENTNDRDHYYPPPSYQPPPPIYQQPPSQPPAQQLPSPCPGPTPREEERCNTQKCNNSPPPKGKYY